MRKEFGGHDEKRDQAGAHDGNHATRTRPTRSCSSGAGDLAQQEDLSRALLDGEERRRSTIPVIGVASSHVDGRRPAQARPRQHHRARRRHRRPGRVREADQPALRYVDGDYTNAATFKKLKKALGEAQAPAPLPRDPARACSRRSSRGSGRRAAPRTRASSSRSRSAATSRRPRSSTACCTGLPRASDLPHRPLPRQGAGAEPPLLPLRQLVPRADLEPQLRRQRADHHGRGLRRAGPRRVLRGGRRDPRRRPEPPAPGGRAAGDGAAGRARRRGSCATRR